MALAALRKFFSGSTPIVLLMILLLSSLYFMSEATHNSELFSQIFSLMLVINGLAIFLLIGLIIRNLAELIRHYRTRTTGSRLTARLVILFVILSVTPVSVVYYFSLDFLQRGIDSWFDVRVDNALQDALELSQAALGVRMREQLQETKKISAQLRDVPNELAPIKLNDLRILSGAVEMTLFSLQGRIIASSNPESANLLPVGLDNAIQRLVRQGQDDVGLIPLQDSDLHIRVVIPVAGPDAVTEHRILQALFAVPDRLNALANNVQDAFGNYREVAFLRTPLKYSFILTLSLVLLLSMLTAIWAAFFYARRLVAPITDLVEGTRAVAAGNYEKRLPLPSKDELGFLVKSFNEMTHRIAMATESAQKSQHQVEEQNAYLEVVLAHLSSGVLTLDAGHTLHTSNATASQILGIPLAQFHGQLIDSVAAEHPHLQLLVEALYPNLESEQHEWQDEITLFGPAGRQVLMCRGTRLPHTVTLQGGHVVVFDDITSVLQAQRNAAWGEVARRLAHEIKNPLTPIQLCAERLRHKYLASMTGKDAEVLDRSTHTIVQQVETLKEMVKAFSDYARMPSLQMQGLNLNKITQEVLDLYRHEDIGFELVVELDPSNPLIEADPGRLRQLLHNLLKNAQEAVEQSQPGRIAVISRCMQEETCRFVELRIEDNGPGFPEDVYSQLFEPYITTKPKGSGLGLAIVKKIVEEHGGVVWAENLDAGGAAIIVRLPVLGHRRQKDRQTALAKSPPAIDNNAHDAS
ncbi:MAG: ATP-binding protein [Gammaproteobacteria bacterium]